MADMDPESAFLESQMDDEYDPTSNYSSGQAYDPAHVNPAAMGEEEEEDEDEEYDPSAAFAPYPARNTQSPSGQSASMPPESAANSPPPATADQEMSDVKPQPAQPAKQPRTRGGFVVDSEDDEDEAPESKKPEASGLDGVSHSPSPALSQTHTPSNAYAPPNVPVVSAQVQDLGPSGVSSSTSVPVHDQAPVQSPAVTVQGNPVPDQAQSGASKLSNAAPALPAAAQVSPVTASLPKARLPQDRVGIFEDRIAEDPRGDIEAWLGLIEELRRRHKIDDARGVYDRFLKIFPTAAEQWNEFVKMELDFEEMSRVERLFERSIGSNPHVGLWSTYINYIRRVHNVNTKPEEARKVIISVFEFVVDNIGIDIGSGRIWLDYIDFIKSSVPGNLGGKDWLDQQKMDVLRAVYQRAIAIPMSATMEIWREYDKFELNLNKATGRKNLQENSHNYMTARSANNVLENITRGIDRTTLPKLPPVQGFDGYDEYMNQVKLWKQWIQWEKDDPLMLKDSADPNAGALYNKRVLYLYKQSLMALRFWPELWYDAAEWCFENGLEKEGNEFLTQGIDANPESCLLAFRQAHQIEFKGSFDEGDAGIIRKGEAVREPYDRVLTELYDLTDKMKKREEQSIARTKETFAAQQAAEEAARANMNRDSDDEDGDAEAATARRQKEKEEALQMQLHHISSGYNAQIKTLKRTISYVWIALMRSMRRIQGKGAPGGSPPGFRGIFAEARKKGKLLSDAYVASALIEHHCYQDVAASKIFDRGLKLFPDDEQFALEYIKHLVKQNDVTNARAVFETIVNRLNQKPGAIARAKPLFVFFHEYESQFGELAQIVKLEKRMVEYFPEDPQLARFAQRFAAPTFDPTTVRPVISLKSQMRPKMPINVVPTVEEPQQQHAPPPPQLQVQEPRHSPAPISPRAPAVMPVQIQNPQISHSPKRPFEDVDNELAQPRKLPRGESPLKGAAGRRLDAARRNMMARASENNMSGSSMPTAPPPAPLPREITFLLSIIPGRQHYGNTANFNAVRMVELLARTELRLPEQQQQHQLQQQQQQQAFAQPPPQQVTPAFAQPQQQMGQMGWEAQAQAQGHWGQGGGYAGYGR